MKCKREQLCYILIQNLLNPLPQTFQPLCKAVCSPTMRQSWAASSGSQNVGAAGTQEGWWLGLGGPATVARDNGKWGFSCFVPPALSASPCDSSFQWVACVRSGDRGHAKTWCYYTFTHPADPGDLGMREEKTKQSDLSRGQLGPDLHPRVQIYYLIPHPGPPDLQQEDCDVTKKCV